MAKLFGQAFIKALEERTKSTQSRVIHAMDIANTFSPDAPESARQELVERACHLAAAVEPHIVALKLNYPLVLATGLEIAHHLKTVAPNLPLIADFKVADIDNTNAWIARHTYAAGIDAIIVQGFIGDDAIQGVLNEARNFGDRGVILVVDMSHPGSLQFIHPQTPKLAKLAVKLKVTGVISPGTRPPHVRDIRTWVGPNTLVLAPGVGAQGGKPGSAIAAGADYEIIGRSIYQAEDPAQTAREFAKQTFEAGEKQDTGPSQREAIIRKVALLLDDVGAIKFGSFTLASGKNYYIDLRIIPSFPDAFSRLTDLFVEWLAGQPKVSFDRIAGVPTAGISFATALSQRLNTPMLYVRSQPKKYGRQQRVEGILEKGDKVLVVDDLITDGGSKLTVVKSVRAAGAKVSDVLVVVDREQGGADQLAKEKLALHSLAPITQIVRALFAEKRLSQEETNGILAYIAEDQ
ncbi:MAG: orotidine-5'-phosphate decarboxylase [Candidatus Hermodarchaeia archaeon]|jgi:orotidine 5'-phosphate decarboxylase subfamily 1/orotate phosphoribosyltransferase